MAANQGGQRAYDVLVWGATGFVGQLVCEQIVREYQVTSYARHMWHGRLRSVAVQYFCVLPYSAWCQLNLWLTRSV